jgi:sugar phosphate isomerase/epimerase
LGPRQFGVSTHLYHGQRLSRDQLLAVAQHGFGTIELFATRTHFDYHSSAAVGDLQEWLADAGLELHGIHAPITDSFIGGRPGVSLSLASVNPDRRAAAVAEAEQALFVARRIPVRVLVLHLGVPRTQSAPGENTRDSARRSVEELQKLAAPLGVRIAVEVIPNELSRAGSLVHFVEEDLDVPDVGICLDFGHAHMDGDVVESIETVSGHVITTHVHDNRGRSDDHLVPFDGTIDWPGAMTAVQKIGYDQTLLLEIAAHGTPRDTLMRAQRAREKLQRLLAD